jgi:TonB-dependent starch-binding outer membrane protein SusC
MNKMLYKSFLIILLTIITISVVGQTQINGTVTSGEDGLPLPGATIFVKETTVGTTSGADGEYKLTIPEGKNTLVFSFIGLVTQEIEIGNKTIINCTLQTDNTQIEEVVAIGYGAAKKGSITGAIAKIDDKRLNSRPVARVEQALSGQMAGVRVRATTGDLGAPLQISVRGKSSVSASNEPLYVVDGFPSTDIGDLVTSDIASINVLKDASTAAIYGSRGANGVVIITTKSGKKGKAKFSFNAYYGLQTVEKKMDLLNSEEWIDASEEMIDKRWVNLGNERGLDYQASDSNEFRESELGSFNKTYMHDPLWQYGADSLAFIDWQDELFRTAPVQEYQLSASGGTESIIYHISGTYMNQKGIIKYTDFTRLNFRSNLKINFNDKLSLDLNISPSNTINNGGRATGKDAMVHYAIQMAPVADKDVGLETGVYPNPTYAYAGSPASPVAYMREIHYRQEDLRIRTNIALNYKFTKSLTARFTGAMDNRSLKLHRYIPTNVQRKNTNEEEGYLSSGILRTNRDNKYLLEATLNYNQTFGKHTIGALGGYSVENRSRDNAFQKNTLFNNDKLITFNEATSSPQNSFYEMFEDRMISYFSRLQYNYSDRYLLSASIRRDGSSRFGKNNLWGTFPSFSAGWRVSNEQFMNNVDFISSLKLRYSIGETGNNTIPYYRAYAEMASSNYSFGNQIAYGLATSTLENQDLGWEKTVSSNYGLDMGLLKNRIFISADYYHKNTSDMLYYVPVAAVTGFSNGWQNIGEMKNQGFELELTTRNLVNDFKWETFLNFSRNTNEVVALGPDNTPILAGFQGRTQVLKVGEPMFSYFMYDAIGVYKDQTDVDNSPSMKNSIPGDVKYRDVNNDEVIDELDKTIVGNPEPDYFWGITNVFNYKNFDLSVLLQGQVGGDIYGIIGRAFDSPSGGTTHNRPKHWNQRWRSEEDPGNGSVPRLDGTTSGFYDSRWLYDASYWKVKNVTLTYHLPKNIINGLTDAQIYFSGDNLFMKDKYVIGFSPEAENNEGGDYGGYPLARVLTLGVRISF